jgi:hypothetical protein
MKQKGSNNIDIFVFFQIFTNIATIRPNFVAGHIVRSTEMTSMQERNILDGVVIFHENIHEHKKKLNKVIFTIDFEKACDVVK